MSDRLTVQIADGIADVRLDRPDKLNGLDRAMFEALVATGARLAADRSLRAVVLSGNGRAFCAGLDFASFAAEAAAGGPIGSLLRREPGAIANFAQQAVYAWTSLPVPVIAAVHGVAYGGGLQLALGADIRFVTADARLSVMEITWGLVPDMTGTQTLRHLARLDVVKELVFTGRVVTGAEAVALGLATHVSDRPLEAALGLARDIASRSPDAVRAAKRLLDAAATASLADGLALEEREQRAIIGGANQAEAVRANFEKRSPKFEDPA